MKRRLVFHPFLFAAFPVLSLFEHNFWEIAYLDIVLEALAFMAVTLSFSAVLFFGLGRIFKSYEKSGILTSLFLISFFSYGHFVSVLRAIEANTGIIIGHNNIVFAIYLFLFVVILKFIFIDVRAFNAISRIFNVASFVLIIFPLTSITLKFSGKKPLDGAPAVTVEAASPRSAGTAAVSGYPDIYYLVFDRYANVHSLQEFFAFDNSEFLNKLSSLGFYVANESSANYLTTSHSLSSTFNMEYINWLQERAGNFCRDWSLMHKELIKNHKLLVFLKSKGYKILHFGSWWQGTAKNKYADYNFTFGYSSRFQEIIMENTLIIPLFNILRLRGGEKYSHWKRERQKLARLEEIPRIPGPTFTFAHMLIPHHPFVFDKEGNFREKLEGSFTAQERLRELYIDQVIYINKRIVALVEKLIADSAVKPIIIIQSDEGPHPYRYSKNQHLFNWTTATDEELRQKMGVLNAYYLPGIDEGRVLYPTITPVNTFRIVLHYYFNEPLELLEDRNYIFRDQCHLYEFFDVTSRIKFSNDVAGN